MAIIQTGSVVGGISGSVGGMTFSRNKGGAYVRNRTKPVNPNTTRQQAARSIISALPDLWAALTAAQREAWATYAANTPLLNALGALINVSGYNMFCRTNAAVLYHGITLIEDAPTTFNLAPQDTLFAVAGSAAASEIDITFDASADWAIAAGGYLLLYESKPQNATVNFCNGPFTLLGKITGAAVPPTSPATLTSNYTLTSGQKTFVQARVLLGDGRLSNPFRAGGAVGA